MLTRGVLIARCPGCSTLMAKDIVRLNIEYYRRKLAEETDPTRRQMIMRLLAKEEAKLASNEAPIIDLDHEGQLEMGCSGGKLGSEKDRDASYSNDQG